MHAAAHQQRLARLGEALQELPERQREAFVLSRFDGLTQDEVAARMQISRRMVVSIWRVPSPTARSGCTMLRLRRCSSCIGRRRSGRPGQEQQ